jgi:DNA-binding MarR family transcriptional regulator
MGSDGVRLGGDLMDVTMAMRRLVRRRPRGVTPPPDLRPAQVELMLVVDRRPGVSVTAAARELRLADNSVSTLVNQLIRAGMLRRETDPDDRRAARLELTAAARRRIADWRDRRAHLVGARLDELSDEDRASIAAALPALRRLLARLAEPADDTADRLAGPSTEPAGAGRPAATTAQPSDDGADRTAVLDDAVDRTAASDGTAGRQAASDDVVGRAVASSAHASSDGGDQ